MRGIHKLQILIVDESNNGIEDSSATSINKAIIQSWRAQGESVICIQCVSLSLLNNFPSPFFLFLSSFQVDRLEFATKDKGKENADH